MSVHGSVSVDHQEKLRNFDLVVLAHLQSAFGLARWYVRNEDDAKDLVQEAMLRAFKAFDTFRGENGRVWLLTIVRNLYFSSVSRKQPDQTVFNEEIHLFRESFQNPEVLMLRSLDSQLIRQGIEQLPEEFREVLVLREMEDLAYKEIAEVVKVPIGTVMSRLARAREQLRQNLLPHMTRSTGQKKQGRNTAAK